MITQYEITLESITQDGKIVAEFSKNPLFDNLHRCEYISIIVSITEQLENENTYNINNYEFPNIYVDNSIISFNIYQATDIDWLIEQIANHTDDHVLISASDVANSNISPDNLAILASKFNDNGFSFEKKIEASTTSLFVFKRINKRNAYGVIIYPCIRQNLGDYTQAVAAISITQRPEDAVYLRREELDKYLGKPLPVIANGWFSHTPIKAASPKLIPLYISIHITHTAQKWFSNKDITSHLEKNAPIGCRDISTKRFIESHNISAYESKCLTLALGDSIATNKPEKNNAHNVYFVDPPIFKPSGILNKLIFASKGLLYPRLINRAWILSSGYPSFFWKLYIMLCFSSGYKTLIKEIGLNNITFHTQHHFLGIGNSRFSDISTDIMEKLSAYQSAQAVITGRIHVALPASAAGANIVFLVMGNHTEEEKDRITDHADFFNTYITLTDNILPIKKIISAIGCTKSKARNDAILKAISHQKQIILGFLEKINN